MVHGVLLVNKPEGVSSHHLVSSLRKILGQKKVGHGGTLDPMARGLMLLLLGQATKISNYLLMNDKQYRFVLKLGVRTDTLDRTGQVLQTRKVDVTEGQIREALLQGVGKLKMEVPLCSAVKVKGKKLYEYMRSRQAITPPVREMNFYDLKIWNIGKDTAEVEISCAKGSYVRSWVEFVGQKLGTGACLQDLVRLKSHPFKLTEALSLQEVADRLQRQKEEGGGDLEQATAGLKPAFIPFSQALPHLPFVKVSPAEERDLNRGRLSPNLFSCLKPLQKQVNLEEKAQNARILNGNQMVALLHLKPFASPEILRVFHKT